MSGELSARRPVIGLVIAVGILMLAVSVTGCGLPGDIVGDAPTPTANPNATPSSTQAPPTPGTDDVTPTASPTAGPIDHPELEASLTTAEARWSGAGHADYDFVFRWLCFCPPEYGQHARASVRNGRITTVVDAETGELHPLGVEEFRTIDGLFAYIREELRGSTERIEVEFDELTGVPLSARFDRIVDAIDDEIAFEVSDFTAH